MPEGYKVLKEGQARILQKGNDVFYNEAQVTRAIIHCLSTPPHTPESAMAAPAPPPKPRVCPPPPPNPELGPPPP